MNKVKLTELRTTAEIANNDPANTSLWPAVVLTLIDKLTAPQAVPAGKPRCKECAKWVQEQADNKEWVEGVAEGRRIVEKLAAKELQCRNS